jgi:hypothetical protein
MSRTLNILLNTNNPKCFIKNYMENLHKFNINVVNHMEPRIVNFNKKKFNKFHLFNMPNNLVSNESIDYTKDLEEINGVVVINNECHYEDLLFELGYLYRNNPEIPLFYGNNFSNNSKKFNNDNIKIPKLLCNFNNLDFYNNDRDNSLGISLYNFLDKIYYRNNTNSIKLVKNNYKKDEDYYKYNIQDSLLI